MFNLAEDLMILAIDDEKGKVISSASIPIDYGLIGALIMELSLKGKIGIDDGKIIVLDKSSTKDELLDNVLHSIKNCETCDKEQAIKFVINKLVNDYKNIEEIIINRLISKGVIKKEEHKILWVFNFYRYPATDKTEEKTLISHIKEIVFDNVEPDVRTSVLISFLRVCNLIEEIFTKEELEKSASKIREIAYSNEIIKAVSQSVFEIQQAILSTITNSGMIPPNSDMLSTKF